MLCATFGCAIDRLTDTTWLRSISPWLLASRMRWPSSVIGIGGPARMPWLWGELAFSGNNRVCAGPAGRSTRLVRVLPLLLCTVTSSVSAQFMAFWMRRVIIPDCDQSHTPVCGVKRRLGATAGLKVTRRSTSPSAVCSALYCGKIASVVATCTTSAGRTKLNRVCWPAGAANSGVVTSNAKTADSERRIIWIWFSQTAENRPVRW